MRMGASWSLILVEVICFLLLNSDCCQGRSQELQSGGGLFWRCETKLKQFTFGIIPVLCPKLGEDQKKGLGPGWDRVFATEFSSSSESKQSHSY